MIYYFCSQEDIDKFREEMVRRQQEGTATDKPAIDGAAETGSTDESESTTKEDAAAKEKPAQNTNNNNTTTDDAVTAEEAQR